MASEDQTVVKSDDDCPRCRGGGCEWCENTGKQMVRMPLSDANDLDAVVHELCIEDSDVTPIEAVRALRADLAAAREEIARLRDALKPFADWCGHVMAIGSRRLADDESPPISGAPDMKHLYRARAALAGGAPDAG